MANKKADLENNPIDQAFFGSRTILGGMRLNSRITLFIFIGLLSIIVMLGLIVKSKKELDLTLQSLQDKTQIVALVSRLETTIVALNNLSQGYNIKQSNGDTTYESKSSQAAQLLVSLQEFPDASNAQKMIAALIKGITKHATHFQNIVRIRSTINSGKNINLKKKVVASGTKLQRRIAISRNNSIINQIGVLRELEQSIQQVKNLETAENILKALTNLRQSVIASTIPNSIKIQIDKDLRVYATDLENLVQYRVRELRELALMEEVNVQFTNNLRSLKNFSKDNLEDSQSTIVKFKKLIWQLMGLGPLAIIGLITVFGTVILYSLVKPVKLLAKSAMDLANGKNPITFPAIENHDETGDLAVALTCFKDNMIQADLLREELETLLKFNQESSHDNALVEDPMQPNSSGEGQQEKGEGYDKIPQIQPEKELIIGEDKVSLTALTQITKIDHKTTPISQISQMVAETSRVASNAAKNAERGDSMVNGLKLSMKKISDIELLLVSVSDHMSLLAVQTSITKEKLTTNSGDAGTSAVETFDKSESVKASEFVSENLDTLQVGTKRAIKAIQQVGESINEVNLIATTIAEEASDEALTSATQLLEQSENLRVMLDQMVDKVKTGNESNLRD